MSEYLVPGTSLPDILFTVVSIYRYVLVDDHGHYTYHGHAYISILMKQYSPPYVDLSCGRETVKLRYVSAIVTPVRGVVVII